MSISPTSLPRRPMRYLVAAAIAVCLFLYWSTLSGRLASPFQRFNSHGIPATNATLGFGRIFAVSKQGSPRLKGLIQAANVTDIDITVPIQPRWTLEDEENFRLPENSTLGRGSLLAWLGHLHALRECVCPLPSACPDFCPVLTQVADS